MTSHNHFSGLVSGVELSQSVQNLDLIWETGSVLYDQIEEPKDHRRLFGGSLALLSSLALLGAGCGSSDSGSGDKISKCETDTPIARPIQVKHPNDLVAAYVSAGDVRLLSEYAAINPTTSADHRAKVVNTANQLFDFKTVSSNASGGFIYQKLAGGGTTKKQLDPTSNKADDPGELMCVTKNADGDPILALTGEAIKAKVILEYAGTPVRNFTKLVVSK